MWTARAGRRAGLWRRVATPLTTRVGLLARTSQGKPNPGFAREMAAEKWRRRMTPALMPT